MYNEYLFPGYHEWGNQNYIEKQYNTILYLIYVAGSIIPYNFVSRTMGTK